MENLYSKYYKLMRYKVSSFRLDVEEDDVIIDACVKLIQKIPLLKTFDSCTLASYIVTTVISVAIDRWNKVKKEKDFFVWDAAHDENSEANDFTVESAIDTVIDAAPRPDIVAIKNETIAILSEAIGKLPERDRFILESKNILEMTDKEIAKNLGISPNSVREYLTRARRKAMAVLKERGVDHAGDV